MKDVNEAAQRILSMAREGEMIEVIANVATERSIRVYEGSIEESTTAMSSGLGVRVLVDGPDGARVGSSWAGSLDDDAALGALNDARVNAEFSTPDADIVFAHPDGIEPVSLRLFDAGIHDTSVEAKIDMVLELERRALAQGAGRARVESANYEDFDVESVIMSTNGIDARQRRSGAYVSVEVIAGDRGDEQTGWSVRAGRAPGDLNALECADEAVERAISMLGATKPTSRRGPVVFDPRVTATFMSIVGGALSGDALVRGRSLFEGRTGEVVASPLWTLVDDASDPRHFAAAPFDAEGLASRRTTMIEGGVLHSFVYDTVSARRAGAASTANAVRSGATTPSAGCRALALQPGELTDEELIASVGEGIYVTSLLGVHSGVNIISGDFSVGVTGFVIRDGRLAEPIREATIASTIQRMLLDVSLVGAEVKWLPGIAAAQAIAIDNVALSGR